MKTRLTYKFFDTEDAARDFCDRENRAHPRRKNRAHYTPWSSSDQQEHKHIVWYYIAEGVPAMKPNATAYEIRQIDAYICDDEWIYNTTYRLGDFATASADVPRAFRRALATMGIKCQPHATRTEYDGDVYEIVDRKTGAPLFCAIPQEV